MAAAMSGTTLLFQTSRCCAGDAPLVDPGDGDGAGAGAGDGAGAGFAGGCAPPPPIAPGAMPPKGAT